MVDAAAVEGVTPVIWQNEFATFTPTCKMRSERDISGELELEPEVVDCCGSESACPSLMKHRSLVRNASTEISCVLFKSARSDRAWWAFLHTNMKCW